MTKRKTRDLLPAVADEPASDGGPPPSKQLVAKRKPIATACEFCRKRKVRCDGQRPGCTPCLERKQMCCYQPDEFTKENIADMKANNEKLEEEKSQLLQLFNLLSSLPMDAATKILGQIRVNADPAAMLRLARETSVSAWATQGADVVPMEVENSDPRLHAINLRALIRSPLKVSAKPWTTVAGDGIVSELISSFFLWDDSFFVPFIDGEAFIEDMRSTDVQNATYCSPFLVNAICASRSFTSRTVQGYSKISGTDLGTKFMNEAKNLLALEGDKASITTVQGLAILFTVTAYRGTDRLGLTYRSAAYEMLNRLKLSETVDTESSATQDSEDKSRHKVIVSKILWGLFCFESIVAYIYLEQSLIPPPTIPRCFDQPSLESNPEGDSGVINDAFRKNTFVPGILNAICDLSELLYRVMQWNSSMKSSGHEDMSKRRRFYPEAQDWRRQLPDRLKEEHNFTSQTYLLRIYYDEVVISLFRPMNPKAVFDPCDAFLPRDYLLQCATRDVELSKRWIKKYTLADYASMNLWGLYNSVLILTDVLTKPTFHNDFVDACMMIREMSSDFPMAKFILQGVQAMAWSLNVAVPARAIPYLQNPGCGKEELHDLPLDFALPQTDTRRKMLGQGEEGGEELSSDRVGMGVLLSKWSEMLLE